MLAPQWTQPKIGPILRGEKDKRYYIGLFGNADYVAGLRRIWALARYQRIPETQADAFLQQPRSGSAVITFTGMEHKFSPLVGHEAYLRDRFVSILSPRCRNLLEERYPEPVAVHIRRGDHGAPLALGQVPPPHSGWTLPNEFYINCVRQARDILGHVPVRLFTDAFEHQIRAILDLGDVVLSPQRPAPVDILHMSRAKVLISSTNSTFAEWAFFFGQMPSLWYPCSVTETLRNLGYAKAFAYSGSGTLFREAQDAISELLVAKESAASA